MPNPIEIPGIQNLWAKTQGDSRVRVAVLDGLVDQTHPCFRGANLTRLPTLVQGEASPEGRMSMHGTHVTSVIFAQPGSEVLGIAPRCQGLIIPIFVDRGRRLSQLDLSRAIEQAVAEGAHIINISGGQLTDYGEAEDWLKKAVRLCHESNVLIVAATGNDGCECLHVPAALPAALAVGAMDDLGRPMDFSNWGEAYKAQGILAPGENILGALPGGGTARFSGTSCATPIVTGVAALLLSLQLQRGEEPNPYKVRAAILESAIPCDAIATDEQRRCLVGKLNISGAEQLILGGKMSDLVEAVNPSGCGCEVNEQVQALVEEVQKMQPATAGATTEAMVAASAHTIEASSAIEASSPSPAIATAAPQFSPSSSTNSVMPNKTASYITASQAPSTAWRK